MRKLELVRPTDGAAPGAEASPAAAPAHGPVRVVVCGPAGAGKTGLLGRLTAGAAKQPGRRRLIVAEAPADARSTLELAEGAATCDVAVLVVDAADGLTEEVRRLARLVTLLGARAVTLAVNKMDGLGYARTRFERIAEAFLDHARALELEAATAIPVSASDDENVAAPGARMRWYRGPTLLAHLEALPATVAPEAPFRMSARRIERGAGEATVVGPVLAGRVAAGDEVVVLPAGARARVAGVETLEDADTASPTGLTVAVRLENGPDPHVGDVLAAVEAPPEVSDRIAADLVWFGDEPMLAGRVYDLKAGDRMGTATVMELKHKVNVDTLEHQAAKTLDLGEIGAVKLSVGHALTFDPYARCRALGGFVLLDRATGAPVGLGTIHFGLRRASNIHWQATDLDKSARAALKKQRPCVLWFTGLSGAGKSTVANLVDRELHAMGRHTYLLDGDNVRHGLNKDLGFTDADRVENVRRVAEVAKLFVDAGLIVMASFISPFESERRMARELFADGEFIEVFVDTPLEICEQRDVKALYKKARAGLIKNFTGIDSVYEAPGAPELHLRAGAVGAEALARQVIEYLEARGLV